MFDAFMERTLPFWLTLSALFTAGASALLFQAAARLRRMRGLLDEATRRAQSSRHPEDVSLWRENEDWVPAP